MGWDGMGREKGRAAVSCEWIWEEHGRSTPDLLPEHALGNGGTAVLGLPQQRAEEEGVHAPAQLGEDGGRGPVARAALAVDEADVWQQACR
jgi:hypothetical protein